MTALKRLVVLDGKSVFYRGYYAMPNLATKEGTPTGGVYGFAVMALEILKRFRPDYVCVAWDKAKTNIRRRTAVYPLYKANRKPAPDDFYEQIPILYELLEALGWPLYEIDDHEADDIMGTFARQALEKSIQPVLITSDRDVLQLLDEGVLVAYLKKGLTNVEMFDRSHFERLWHMTPDQFIDFKALTGDPADNLPGVKGIGEKTAHQLIDEFHSLDEIYQHLDGVKPPIRQKLEADREQAYVAKSLIILDTAVPLSLDWDKARINNLDRQQLNQVLEKLEFRTLIKQLPDEYRYQPPVEAHPLPAVKIEPKTSATVVSTVAQLPRLEGGEPLFMQVATAGAHGRDLKKILVGDYQASWMVDASVLAPAKLKEWLDDLNLIKRGIIGYDTKQIAAALLWLGVGVRVEHDVKTAAFLLDPLRRDLSLASIMASEAGSDYFAFIEEAAGAQDDARIIDALRIAWKSQLEQLDKAGKLSSVARGIEWPVIPIIASMENVGMKVDAGYLNAMSKRFEDLISDTTQEIYGYANKEFNIASPTQLAEVLFEDLGLPTAGVKKGKKAYSTAAVELEKLTNLHPIVDSISRYREYSKLKSTYLDTLPSMIDPDGRIRTTFSLTATQTGRLSSSDPNLQNIPVRSDLGREVRKAFVADKGKVLISADYSQFELRLAAVLAGDDDLIDSFNNGADIHTRTAAQIYGKAIEDVTKDERRTAKVINFGILYGMSPHGLSQATGMSQQAAGEFIDKYFRLRQPIVDYIDSTKELARTQGFVETLFGRRRPTPDVASSNFVVREAALRAAVNMPIQGTEADIMKMAMVKLQHRLPDDCRQIMQVHDSIIVEAPQAKAKAVAALMKEVMRGIYQLPVNLDVDVSVGQDWGEL